MGRVYEATGFPSSNSNDIQLNHTIMHKLSHQTAVVINEEYRKSITPTYSVLRVTLLFFPSGYGGDLDMTYRWPTDDLPVGHGLAEPSCFIKKKD